MSIATGSKEKALVADETALNFKASNALPEKPVVVIEPSRGWTAVNLKDLWQYRDLFYILMMRDIKVRYKQTVLGAAWAIIQPLFTMLIFTIFFGRLAGLGSDGLPYPIFAYAGLLPWTFFSNAVTGSGNSLVGNSNLITKVYFPRMVIPVASVAAGLVDLAIAFVLLVAMMFYYGVGLSINMLMLPVLVLIFALLGAGVGMWMSALNVKYRDIRYALPFLIQLGMFASGIITPIPERFDWLMFVNPIAALIEAFRAACFGKPFDWLHLAVAGILTVAVLIFSAYNFRKMERGFADIV
jgi:lipopolysaccharide transport system permease protein